MQRWQHRTRRNTEWFKEETAKNKHHANHREKSSGVFEPHWLLNVFIFNAVHFIDHTRIVAINGLSICGAELGKSAIRGSTSILREDLLISNPADKGHHRQDGQN